MITARPQKDLKAAKQYFRQHLVRGDYYSEDRKIQGQWFGKGAARLGLDLAQPVSEGSFLRLCENLHPVTGQPLTVRHRKTDRRVFYDFVVSAPKSVSVMAITLGDSRIIAAHDMACRVAMERMETLASARVRKGGRRTERLTGEVVGAVFRHEESRALDPQLHTHFLFFNATWDSVESRWKALEPTVMFDQIRLHTEIYRSELAKGLRECGYRLRTTANGFEIEGVSPKIIDRFSKRRRAILEEEGRISERLGKPISNNARAAVAHSTRDRKRRDLSSDELREYQRRQLDAGELERLNALKQGMALPPPGDESAAARVAIDYARDHLFERSSVVSKEGLLRVALASSRGETDLPALEKELARRTEFIRVDGALTTKEALRVEQRLVALVNQGIGGCLPIRTDFKGSPSLTEEQQVALQFILRSTNEVIALRGLAGTGKSRLLQEVVRGIEERHGAVVLAPSAAAVDVLRQQGCAQTATVQKFLVDPGFQENCRGKALVVDEAGLLPVNDLLALVEATRALRGRLILSGDTRQHHSVGAGDALRVLEEHSALQTVEIKSIKRQVHLEYCAAISELAKGEGPKALRRLESMGAIREVPDELRYQELARAYLGSLQEGKSALVVSPTWREIDEVNGAVRQELKAAGALAPEESEVVTHRGLKWTRAQKRTLQNYHPGMILTFHKGTREFGTNEWAEVRTAKPDMLEVQKPNGDVVRVTRKQADCFDVAEQVPIPVAVGDRLLLQATVKSAKLFNGQIVTVKERGTDGAILLTDGRQLKPDFRAFSHGYCVTSYASQGRTVDHVYVAMDSKASRATNQNQFYVSSSRGRERVVVYTDDLKSLRAAVARPGNRLSATELVESARLAANHGVAIHQAPGETPSQRRGPGHVAR